MKKIKPTKTKKINKPSHSFCKKCMYFYPRIMKVCSGCDHVYAEWLDDQFEARGSR